MAGSGTSTPALSRQERFDLRFSRSLPKLSTRANRLLIRLSGGRLGAQKRGIPIALLTTSGRRSGRPRTVPLMYLEDGDRYVVVASNGGYDEPPAWFLNLGANPAATFEPRGTRLEVMARVLDGGERVELWPKLVAHNPLWASFQSYTDRETAVVELRPA
jgi:F420H(2)-dependent quinone reductase